MQKTYFWVAAIASIRTGKGFASFAVVIDRYTPHIMGWSMQNECLYYGSCIQSPRDADRKERLCCLYVRKTVSPVWTGLLFGDHRVFRQPAEAGADQTRDMPDIFGMYHNPKRRTRKPEFRG